MAAREALAAPIDQRMLWPREALAAQIDQRMLWPREKRWLLDLITKRCWSRISRLSAVRFLVAPLSPCARADVTRIRLLSSSPTLVAGNSFDCPASPEKEDQRAAGSPAASTQLALCLRLAIDLKGRKLATRRNPR